MPNDGSLLTRKGRKERPTREATSQGTTGIKERPIQKMILQGRRPGQQERSTASLLKKKKSITRGTEYRKTFNRRGNPKGKAKVKKPTL